MKMLIAGGGTGGHLYPGVALAEDLTTRQKGNEVLFVGTERGIEARVIPELGYPLAKIDVAGLKRQGLVGLLRGLLKLPGSFFQCRAILKRFAPDVAVGVGGYASGPMIMSAWLSGIPTVILEQNTVPGITNRILGRFVNQVFVTFESSSVYFPKRKVQALGNPIRRALLENFLRSKLPGPSEVFTILVLGGSQGAHAVNLRMIEAAGHLGELEGKLRVVHQSGAADEEIVRRGYTEIGFDAEVVPFIEDMSAAYRRADLVIARAGATTIAEIQVVKKASLLIPYPYAADNHQELNAKAMVDAGASIMLVERELDGPRLAQEIRRLYADRDRLLEMERAASRVGRPEAAREIVDACAELVARRVS